MLFSTSTHFRATKESACGKGRSSDTAFQQLFTVVRTLSGYLVAGVLVNNVPAPPTFDLIGC